MNQFCEKIRVWRKMGEVGALQQTLKSDFLQQETINDAKHTCFSIFI